MIAETSFLRDAVTWAGSTTPRVLPLVLLAGLFGTAVAAAARPVEDALGAGLGLAVAPYEIAGALLGLLLVLRTNAGYDRWWEARKLWGGIVNQSRNLATAGMVYGPADPDWRDRFARAVVAFPHAARAFLRGEPPPGPVVAVLGPDPIGHGPTRIAFELAKLLREATDRHGMDRFVFLQADKERATLIDHIGGCERIVKSPLPRVFAIKVRRFILMFLLALPFALLHKLDSEWLVPVMTMLLAYPVLGLDRIGVELQNPFALDNLSHLPLNDICATIERNVAECRAVADAAGPGT